MLTFDAEQHEYRVDGARVPHVTQITGELQSYFGVPESVMAIKRDIGQAVHLATQYHDEGDLDIDSLPDIIRPYVDAYIKFRTHTGFVPSAIEQRVYSPRYKYAGTLDRVGNFNSLKGIKPNQGAVVDLKATYTIAPAVGPQVALYTEAWNEQEHTAITRRFALQLKPDGTYNLHECKDAYDLSVALCSLSLINWKARHIKGKQNERTAEI
jgi:hypothetical protein